MTSPLPLPLASPAPAPRFCRCGRRVPKGPLVEGWGSGCAEEQGLVTHVPRYRRLTADQDALFEINEGDEMTAETYTPKFVYDDPEEVRALIRVTGDPGALGEIANELLSDLDDAYKRIDVACERLDRAAAELVTMTKIAQGNKRHVADLTAIVEAVESTAIGYEQIDGGTEKVKVYAGDVAAKIRAALNTEAGRRGGVGSSRRAQDVLDLRIAVESAIHDRLADAYPDLTADPVYLEQLAIQATIAAVGVVPASLIGPAEIREG